MTEKDKTAYENWNSQYEDLTGQRESISFSGLVSKLPLFGQWQGFDD